MQNYTWDASSVVEDIIELPRQLTVQQAIIVVAFLGLVRLKVTNLSLAVPAILLAAYHERILHQKDGISTVRYSVLGLLVPWLLTFAYRLVAMRRKCRQLVVAPCHQKSQANGRTAARRASQLPLWPRSYHSQGNNEVSYRRPQSCRDEPHC